MILCPKCGRVNEYTTIEYSHRTGVYNEKGECLKIKDLVTYKKDDPRCSNCGRKVTFFVDESEGEQCVTKIKYRRAIEMLHEVFQEGKTGLVYRDYVNRVREHLLSGFKESD